ncbi:type II toxin-antitoxin system VapC family toxin [Glycomyces tenuis]|uniref:type II toxin-antitoxin system VapC family toxin n=1 Tax=Glycomyces tenuis TaxID=58116 RepID=UPI000478A6DC|nr:PIN domain-containing protein [Glycomyces tenuis]
MILISDSSGILAAVNTRDEYFERARKLLHVETSVISQVAVTEVDHIAGSRRGWEAAMAASDFITHLVTRRGHRLGRLDPVDLPKVQAVRRQYAGLELDLADAIAVVLADKYKTNRILTLDQRDFRAVKPLTPAFDSFTILPADG